MKKKKLRLEYLIKFWPAIAIIGFIIAFSSRLSAVWKTPDELQDAQKQMYTYSNQLNQYVAANEAANKQRDQQIQMWAQYMMEQQRRRY